MKISVLLIFFSWGASSIAAGYLWLEANRFQFVAGETAIVTLKMCENPNGEGWRIKSDRIVRMEHHTSARANLVFGVP